jgi:intracellular septation protein
MKVLFDLLPVILFFVAYTGAKRAPETASAIVSSLLGAGAIVSTEQAPILLATAVAIAATICQVSWLLLRGRKVDAMLWISLAIIVVMGGATLLLRDPTFIKWKPTVLYWAFAAVLLGADLILKKNVIRSMMEKQMTLPHKVWTYLNLSWVGFFALMGAANLFVAFSKTATNQDRFTESQWVNFKLFGSIGLMVVFVLIQGLMLSRFIEHDERNQERK